MLIRNGVRSEPMVLARMLDKKQMTEWRVFPARHGVLLRKTECCAEGSSQITHIESSIALEESFLQRDDRRPNGNLEPPLSLSLSDDEIREIKDTRLAAATHYGPEVQDKASNEDFALSAVIQIADGAEYSFAAVADGVSSRTFWSARTARLACIGTYKAVRECLTEGIDPGNESKHLDIATRVAALVDKALVDDVDTLIVNAAVPGGWDRAIYDKHKTDNAAWYRSTLLFGIIGKNGGVIGITGDGGVRALMVEHTAPCEPVELRVMFAEVGRDLTSYVTRGFCAKDIHLLPLKTPGRLATHIIFASDGLDLTLQAFIPNEIYEDGRRCRSRYRDLALNDANAAFDFLDTLSRDLENGLR